MVDALVLAGSKNNGPLRNVSQESCEALIKIGPSPMLMYVVDALKQCREVDKIVVVGPTEVKKVIPPEIYWLQSGENIMENIQRGNALMQGHYLVASSDIPLLNAEGVSGFLALCREVKADFYFPLISKDAIEKEFPGAKRTYIPFKEGVFTGGNLFLVNPWVVEQCLKVGQELVDLRKKPVALARRVGLLLFIKFLLRVLSLQEVQEKASHLLGIEGKAIICPYPEVGMDIDKPSDLEMVRQFLGHDKYKVIKDELCRSQ
ncbi:conserved hypothetical protein [Desulforamulus reducens MI-1]|uniref:MobA-like NTP transferase domain-containing protein n=1 Tax=Desulforamulus reducens (strain ATCC BAA-1160 / DSM 100696 / MI-1) TaxID=349161 RepID=A4J0P3_DESRM|nr:NTP transferase domain-containing protein [Desulforamulus reducens]ABO48646.1 conserved hypothetical protein [Desulforamulus reducens MI-1]